MTNKVITISSVIWILLMSNTLIFAQCTDDTHSANISDSWVSCQQSTNPNSIRGNNHWVMYDLGYVYSLGVMTIWNYNVQGATGQGFKDVLVDYSVNGVDWIEADQFELPQASGNSNYTGYNNFNFGEIGARYVLITAQNAWNGGSCAGISELRIELSEAALPLELLHFSAQAKDDYIELNWESMNEEKFSHFEVERSVDATNFHFIEKVHAKGNTSINSYALDDLNVKKGQLYYYRLKMVDLDGRYGYSPIRTAQINSHLTFSIYPNPTQDVLQIFLENNGNSTKEIIIQNLSGREFFRIKTDESMPHFDISFLLTGMYICSIVDENGIKMSKRFVKAN